MSRWQKLLQEANAAEEHPINWGDWDKSITGFEMNDETVDLLLACKEHADAINELAPNQINFLKEAGLISDDLKLTAMAHEVLKQPKTQEAQTNGL